MKTTVVARVDAALAGLHVRRRPRGARLRRTGCEEHFAAIKAAAEATTRVGQAHLDRAVRRRPDAAPAVQLHDRRRRRAEHDRQGDLRRLRVDQGQPSGRRALHPLGQHRHRQEALADEHDRDPRPARRRRGGDRPGRAEARHAGRHRRSCSTPARFPRPAPSSRARPTTARMRPTRSRRCSSPPARTPPTSPNRTPRSSTAQLLEDGDYYWSITLPALIVATVGGGTGLATQSECLTMLGCRGAGKADKFAEICAGGRARRRDLALLRGARRATGCRATRATAATGRPRSKRLEIEARS